VLVITATCCCRECEAVFTLPAADVGRGRGQFCTRRCAAKHAQRLRWQVQKRTLAERYNAMVIRRGENECWGWSGFKHRGYGRLKSAGPAAVGAHRLSYELAHGPIPPGLTVLHSCDNPECSNPAHLSLGSNIDNNRDRDSKGRTARGSRSGSAKLDEDSARRIRERVSGGASDAIVAPEFGISASTVRAIRTGRTWVHL
jgi:hypothetical protein